MRALASLGAPLDETSGQLHPSQTPLMKAMAYGEMGSVRLLLELGADLTAADSQGMTAMEFGRQALKGSGMAERLEAEILRHAMGADFSAGSGPGPRL